MSPRREPVQAAVSELAGSIVVVGDLVTDVMAVAADPVAVGSDVAATVTMTGGGAGANTAAWLAHTGARVTLAAAAGDDAIGEQRLAELRAYGVTCAVARHAEATGTVIVLATGSERSMISDRGANASLTPTDIDAALRQSPDCVHLHLSGYTLLDPRSRSAGRHALAAARAAGLSVSVDAASASPLRRVGPEAFLEWARGGNLLLANLDEARVLAASADDDAAGPATAIAAGDPARRPEQLARALTAYADTVIVKLGPDGAVWAASDGETAVAPAVSTQAVDVTGAGDAFAAGAVIGYLAGQTPAEVLGHATALAAAAVARVGARPGAPQSSRPGS